MSDDRDEFGIVRSTQPLEWWRQKALDLLDALDTAEQQRDMWKEKYERTILREVMAHCDEGFGCSWNGKTWAHSDGCRERTPTNPPTDTGALRGTGEGDA